MNACVVADCNFVMQWMAAVGDCLREEFLMIKCNTNLHVFLFYFTLLHFTTPQYSSKRND